MPHTVLNSTESKSPQFQCGAPSRRRTVSGGITASLNLWESAIGLRSIPHCDYFANYQFSLMLHFTTYPRYVYLVWWSLNTGLQDGLLLVPLSGRSGNTIQSERNCGFNLSIIYKCQLQEKTKYQIFTHLRLTVSMEADDIFYRAGDYLRHQTPHSGRL